MKQLIPIALLFLWSCNNDVPATEPTAVDHTENRDSAAIATSDSTSIQAATEVAETSRELRPPPPPAVVPKPTSPVRKSAAKAKAKIDSVAIREANKLPLDQ